MIGKTLVVGIGHKARHGKNAVADAIHAAFPKQTRIYSCAGALKAYCRVAYRMGTKDAPLLQKVGVLFRDHVSPDFWLDVLRAQLEEEAPEVALIPDVRFLNEAQFCDTTIRVTRFVHAPQRATAVLVPYVAQDRPADHPSETALDGYEFDYDITARDGDLARLEQEALAIYRDILSRAAGGAFTEEAA